MLRAGAVAGLARHGDHPPRACSRRPRASAITARSSPRRDEGARDRGLRPPEIDRRRQPRGSPPLRHAGRYFIVQDTRIGSAKGAAASSSPANRSRRGPAGRVLFHPPTLGRLRSEGWRAASGRRRVRPHATDASAPAIGSPSTRRRFTQAYLQLEWADVASREPSPQPRPPFIGAQSACPSGLRVIVPGHLELFHFALVAGVREQCR